MSVMVRFCIFGGLLCRLHGRMPGFFGVGIFLGLWRLTKSIIFVGFLGFGFRLVFVNSGFLV